MVRVVVVKVGAARDRGVGARELEATVGAARVVVAKVRVEVVMVVRAVAAAKERAVEVRAMVEAVGTETAASVATAATAAATEGKRRAPSLSPPGTARM